MEKRFSVYFLTQGVFNVYFLSFLLFKMLTTMK